VFAFVVLDCFSVLHQEIGWEDRLCKRPILCWVGRKTLIQSINQSISHFGEDSRLSWHVCCCM